MPISILLVRPKDVYGFVMGNQSHTNFITRSWNGHEPLWKLWWLYMGIGSIPLAFLVVLLDYTPAPAVMGFLLFMIYFAWWLVSAWRCAFNCDWYGWGYLTRAWISLSLLASIIGITIEFLYRV